MNAHSTSPLRPPSQAHWCSALLLAVAAITWPTGSVRAGEVYKYVDAQGQVVYSDQPNFPASQQAPVDVVGGSPDPDLEVRAMQSPPPLPDSDQPPCPEEGFIWTPGYWAWSDAGYYWVPGAWVLPPRAGVLWTPGYWHYVDSVFVFHRGYWATRVGYYGGINYGHGYFGVGFAGGRWVGNSFAYNRTVSNVDAQRFHNLYGEAVANSGVRTRVSFNGGPGGTTLVPTAQERELATQAHIAQTPLQRQNMVQASRVPMLMPRTPVIESEPEPGIEHHSVANLANRGVSNGPPVREPLPNTMLPRVVRQRENVRSAPNNTASPRPAAARTKPTLPPRRSTSIRITEPGRL